MRFLLATVLSLMVEATLAQEVPLSVRLLALGAAPFLALPILVPRLEARAPRRAASQG